MPRMGSSASAALLPPVTCTSPARRQLILGVTPGLGFFRHPPPQRHPVGISSVNREPLGVTPFPISIAQTHRATLSTGFRDSAHWSELWLPASYPIPTVCLGVTWVVVRTDGGDDGSI